MNDEFKVVTRQETFNDLAVRELAKGRAACICRMQFGRCKENECKKCLIHKQYAACYAQMSDYDRQRLATYVAEEWQKESLFPEQWMSSSGYMAHMLKIVFAVIFGLGLILLALCLSNFIRPCAEPGEPYDSPYGTRSKRVGHMIVSTLRISQAGIYDMNNDGMINCIDYACNFKREWDMLWPDESWRCLLVRNYNGSWHHLFAHVRGYGSEDIEVETWAKDPYRYKMEYNWRDEYNPKYNIYGETELWMQKCRSGLISSQ